jgi:hypothetical protein
MSVSKHPQQQLSNSWDTSQSANQHRCRLLMNSPTRQNCATAKLSCPCYGLLRETICPTYIQPSCNTQSTAQCIMRFEHGMLLPKKSESTTMPRQTLTDLNICGEVTSRYGTASWICPVVNAIQPARCVIKKHGQPRSQLSLCLHHSQADVCACTG